MTYIDLGNGSSLKMWKMTQRFGKWPKYLGNGLDTWDTALVFEKRLYYVGKWLKNLTKGLNM